MPAIKKQLSGLLFYFFTACALFRLQNTIFGKRVGIPARDDDVIQHPDVDESQRLFQCMRQRLVGIAGVRFSRRMIVGQNDAGRIVCQSRLDDFTGINTRLLQGAPKHFPAFDQFVFDIEI